jgi:dipeptidyl aminopeptidase/acylaminoacyl peptidase
MIARRPTPNGPAASRFVAGRRGSVLADGLAIFLAACLVAAVPAHVGAQSTSSFELEDVMSFPYPSAPVAASGADRIAWTEYREGVRNVWTAAAPDFEPQRLTDYAEDDGQPLGDLALTPDGSTVVYVRGGDANRSGEHPNPTSDPGGAEQAVWAVRTGGGEPWKVGEGDGPEPSPDGTEVLFTRGGTIYVAELSPPDATGEAEGEAGGAEDTAAAGEAAPEPLFRARGGNGSPRWSPDGSEVLFTSSRGDHAFVGVYAREADAIRWIAPSVDRDGPAVWSPDGERIAFIRTPGAMRGELYNLTGGSPFSLWVADADGGDARELWSSPGDDGGFAQYYPAHPLRWVADDRLLFFSEHEGWLHVYALSISGGTSVDLTPGEGIAEHTDVSPDGRHLYFSSNREDVDRRHLWRVPTSGGTPEPLTTGEGIETHPVALSSGQRVAFLGATARRPQAVSVVPSAGGESQRIAPESLPDRFPIDDLVVPEPVTFEAADGLEVHGQLFLPDGAAPGDDRPAVIFMHGGPIRQMLLGWHYRGYYANAYAMNQYLASRGYVVLSVNYRAGIGYGRDFRRAEDQGPRGASEYRDIVAAGVHLRGRPEVDPDRIGLWGGSYGGLLTAMGLARDSHLFAAGVDLHGVHDWAFRATDFAPGGGWGVPSVEDSLELARASSPVADVEAWSSPVLFIHGDDDRNVMFQQTTDLVRRLRQQDVEIETLVLPDEVHGFLRHASWLEVFDRTAGFFEVHLKGG